MDPYSFTPEQAGLPPEESETGFLRVESLPSTLSLTSLSLPQGYLPPTKNGAEPKRPSRPINITSLARLSATVPNTIVVNWSSEFGRVSIARRPAEAAEELSSLGLGIHLALHGTLCLRPPSLVFVRQSLWGSGGRKQQLIPPPPSPSRITPCLCTW